MNDRVLNLNNKPITNRPVVYIMSRDQRVADNHALITAQNTALENNVALIVIFNLLPGSGVRSYEHFAFMLNGLKEVESELKRHNISFNLTNGQPETNLLSELKLMNPGAVFLDFSPLHGPRQTAKLLARQLDSYVAVVDTHNIVPLWVASQKQEFAAYTMRFKIHKYLEKYLIEPQKLQKMPANTTALVNRIDFQRAFELIKTLPRSNIKLDFDAGEKAGLRLLNNFKISKLTSYAPDRNNIAKDSQSGFSPYLHYGQMSTLRVALEVMKYVEATPLLLRGSKMAQSTRLASNEEGQNALFEEMIVRKELADNFCFYAKSYRNLEGAPDWAVNTLAKHQLDLREFVYSQEELESASTHDKAWNAAQKQLMTIGKIHGYMRMYWAKKILEWTTDAQTAIDYAIYLNDKYSIDGGDPNGYTGIFWSIAGLHDRPWTERPIFGKIRYMNEAGLRRKFDLDSYISKWCDDK